MYDKNKCISEGKLLVVSVKKYSYLSKSGNHSILFVLIFDPKFHMLIAHRSHVYTEV